MPHRRPKNSIVLGAVALLAAVSPLAVYGATGAPPGVKEANDTAPAAVPTRIAEMVLAAAPDIVLPLSELTGLNLPDLHLSDLAKIPLPTELRIPPELQIPGVPPLPTSIPLPGAPASPGDVTAPGDVAAPAPRPAQPDAATEMGALVKEVTQDTPFSMVAVTSTGLPTTEAKVRARQLDGTWGPWLSTTTDDTTAATSAPATGKRGTEPVFVGDTTAVQILIPPAGQASPASPGPTTPPAPEATPAAPPAAPPAAAVPQSPGFTPAALTRPLTQNPATTAMTDVSAVLIEPGTSAADGALADVAAPLAGSGLKVISRAQWGADESIRCEEPTYDDMLGGAVVHHTAGNNDYSKEESAEVIRGIYAYHAQTLGWCDIGYNVLVDKYGQIFEGRAGGLDRNVQGAHTGGFNENTMGIALMGDYSTVEPSETSLESVGKFLGWRLAKAGLDPKGQTTMFSEGTEFTPYAEGEAVDLPIVFSHRDVGNTTCAGDAAYARMDEIRDIAARSLGGGSATPAAEAPTSDTRAATGDAAGAAGDADADSAAASAGGLPALATELIRLTDSHPVARRWSAEGGDTGRLGPALTGVMPAKNGQQYARFVNGTIYTSPQGATWTVLGKIFERFEQLGTDTGELGLPVSDEYPVPDGKREDFENGSLIFNELTGLVTTILKTYNDVQAAADATGPAAPAPAPAPATPAAPAPAPVAPAVG